jgi:hypothetical protein
MHGRRNELGAELGGWENRWGRSRRKKIWLKETNQRRLILEQWDQTCRFRTLGERRLLDHPIGNWRTDEAQMMTEGRIEQWGWQNRGCMCVCTEEWQAKWSSEPVRRNMKGWTVGKDERRGNARHRLHRLLAEVRYATKMQGKVVGGFWGSVEWWTRFSPVATLAGGYVCLQSFSVKHQDDALRRSRKAHVDTDGDSFRRALPCGAHLMLFIGPLTSMCSVRSSWTVECSLSISWSGWKGPRASTRSATTPSCLNSSEGNQRGSFHRSWSFPVKRYINSSNREPSKVVGPVGVS